jgi:hypothetical protein
LLALRKSWVAPPGWPRPPRGFAPAGDWEPDSTWPPAPEGWKFWRPRWGWLVGAAVVSAVAVVLWVQCFGSLHTWRMDQALDQRGVLASATVVSHSYNPDGGDPDGWTTDWIRYVTATGTSIVAKIGHHDPGSETVSGTVQVMYDPQHPQWVRPATSDGYEDGNGDTSSDFDLLVVGFALAVGATALAATLFSRAATRRPRDEAGRPAEVRWLQHAGYLVQQPTRR